ncbi:hypothetical protein N7539_008869 [Penicillium diatomitis]|uniref:Alcohol dehydrogenase-like C-terminal domain-containing protein n=1 Tax=Penicillium diatomitis TaxID=2819901 RepID=A0A9X0BJ59_9EURO|nr:uncharacterized protein N7539_008869 [Penicillium diatomitis]KAJ5469251.1 hypothetical protein N7539_008869 [Penicillium diatomitis]
MDSTEEATQFEIPTHCKAGVVVNEGPGFHVEVQDVPVPEPGPDDILVRLNFTGLCYTDIHTAKGFPPEDSHSPARYASPIPDGVPDEIAAPIMCSASTIYRSMIESNRKAGAWVVFSGGGGGVGIQGVQLAKAMGMHPIVVDTGSEKRELCTKIGAEAFVDFKKEQDPSTAVIKIADGIAAHGVFVTAPAAYKTAISFVGERIGAIVMCVGLPPAGTTVLGTDRCQFVSQNLSIKGTLVGSRKDTAMALDFARRGMLHQISEALPLNKFPGAVEKLREGQVAGCIVIGFNREE